MTAMVASAEESDRGLDPPEAEVNQDLSGSSLTQPLSLFGYCVI